MVSLGDICNVELAVCCNVLVVNGEGGSFFVCLGV